jgi:hypothetical protein
MYRIIFSVLGIDFLLQNNCGEYRGNGFMCIKGGFKTIFPLFRTLLFFNFKFPTPLVGPPPPPPLAYCGRADHRVPFLQ